MLANKFRFIWSSGCRGEDFKKSANQKQELPVAAMFVNGLGRKEQSLYRTFHKRFLPNFRSIGFAVSEEKIKMWKVNERQTTDAKWWQKLTMPLAVEVVNLKVIPNIVCSHRQNPSTLDLTFFFLLKKMMVLIWYSGNYSSENRCMHKCIVWYNILMYNKSKLK